MNSQYRRAIADALASINATLIVDGEPPEKLREAIAGRVADLGKHAPGYCKRGADLCVCGGESPAVRAGCVNWTAG